LSIDTARILRINDGPVGESGSFVLYWMVAARRTSHNFALDRALEWGRKLDRPVLVFEPLRTGYRWASDRLHRFVIDGMADSAQACEEAGVAYYPYVEPAKGAGRGLLAGLAESACVVVTDDYPAFFLPRMIRAAGAQLDVLLEAVDSNGLLPIRQAERAYATAHQFRRYLHDDLPERLSDTPGADPLGVDHETAQIPASVLEHWPAADLGALLSDGGLADLPIDHSVLPVPDVLGGAHAGRAALDRFLEERLDAYGEQRNEPGAEATSGLSPYLHFGHLSVHEVVAVVLDRENWSPAKVDERARGKRSGWWGVSESAEGFLDELVTWRELGFNSCALDARCDRFDGLPDWARKTLADHERDPRPYFYDLEAFESAGTHDELWNAAQRQLVAEGRIHGYLRMLWGKKILEWSESPQVAFDIMVELNNKYALDGRDPNSYSGISWVLGRYDRPWGPERPVFGKVRYMTSENTARKYDVKGYVQKYGRGDQ
jgi:deoxyribodipyrimidine photo-lyase